MGRCWTIPPLYLSGEDVAHQIVQSGVSWSNGPEVVAAANHYIDAAVAEMTLNLPMSRVWAGFLPIRLDGAVRQVEWTVGSDGKGYTLASRNMERVTAGRSYREKVEIEKQRQMYAEKAAEKRAGSREAKK
jgi:hypothetical protein